MNKQSGKNNYRKYIELTGIAFQMGITIYLGAYFGKKIDANINPSKKTFTIVLTLLALLISIWSVINQLKKINDKYE